MSTPPQQHRDSQVLSPPPTTIAVSGPNMGGQQDPARRHEPRTFAAYDPDRREWSF